MAAKYLRRQTWWVRFYHPITRELVRVSLETHDEARAELLRQRVELESELLDPRFQAAELPSDLIVALGLSQSTVEPSAPPTAPAIVEQATPTATAKRARLDDALTAYLGFIRSENAARHVENKLSMLRRFLGVERTEQFSRDDSPNLRQRRLKNGHKPFFEGEFLDEVTPTLLQGFFDQLEVSKKTKRHYREFFHHFFEYCIKCGLYRPQNQHYPNPMVALPSYVSRNRRILFLSAEEVDAQLETLKPCPAFYVAAALMIYAGLRRAEMLWLNRTAIAQDLSFLSIVNRFDEEQDIESSLKTGERAVTILPPLRRILAEYLPKLKGEWLVCKNNGSRWNIRPHVRNIQPMAAREKPSSTRP